MRTGHWLRRIAIVVMLGTVAPGTALAQSVSAAEREALVRQRVARGGQAEEVDALLRQADEARAKGLPAEPLTNKIREGLAKGVAPGRIGQVVGQMTSDLERASALLTELQLRTAPSGAAASVVMLAEAFGGGVTVDEVRDLRAQAPASDGGPSAEAVTGAAKGLAFIKDAALPAGDGAAVVVEAMRQGFQPYQILDLGREIKRREADYQTGRATLRALREAIARGERPEALFRDSRPDARVVTPDRPGAPAVRPEPVTRPGDQRPDRPRPDAGTRTR